MTPAWTAEQRAVIAHPLDQHAVVHAAPGAGKTTTLVGRVQALLESVDAAHLRVVMFNRAVQETFAARLGVAGVRISTFDALGLEVLRVADRRGLLSRPLRVEVDLTPRLAREIYHARRDDFDSAEAIEGAVAFWKGHLVPPGRAAFPSNPALAEAYRAFERARTGGDTLRVGFEDMVYTAVAVLRQHPELLGRVDHLLVDEFQDVNPARVELIRRLIQPTTTIMAVGDEDQAINEWCGAHPRFFREFSQTFDHRPTRAYRLSQSFRFGPVLATASERLISQNVERTPGGIVGAGTAGEVRAVDDVGDGIVKLLGEGVAPGDIAVLYRGRNQGAAVIAQLVGKAVPVHTEDAYLIRTGRGPELALAYLRAASGHASITFAEAWPLVFAPERYIQKEPFEAQVRRLGARGLKAVLRDVRLAQSLGQSARAVRSIAELSRLLEAMGKCATASKALDRLLREVDVEAQIRARLRSEREQDTAIACFHAVHAFLREAGVAPVHAEQALAELDPTRGVPLDGCVRLSTIHKAKGLEWPHVFLPGIIEGACPAEQRGQIAGTQDTPEGIVQSPWIEQERRIFFVGVTRASKVAWVHTPEPVSRFWAELMPGAAAASGSAASGAATTAPATQAEIVEAMTRPGRSWREYEDADLTELWAKGAGVTAIAEELDRSPAAIAARLVRLGLVRTRSEARLRADKLEGTLR